MRPAGHVDTMLATTALIHVKPLIVTELSAAAGGKREPRPEMASAPEVTASRSFSSKRRAVRGGRRRPRGLGLRGWRGNSRSFLERNHYARATPIRWLAQSAGTSR